jgi:hypothetical protein
MSDEHSAAKMVAGAAAVAMAFVAVGTEDDPNAWRRANRSDWERCLKHPIHPVERPAGQTKAMNFAYNWTDGARVVIIWGPIVLLVIWGLLALLNAVGI